jgi:hypothetical protein
MDTKTLMVDASELLTHAKLIQAKANVLNAHQAMK